MRPVPVLLFGLLLAALLAPAHAEDSGPEAGVAWPWRERALPDRADSVDRFGAAVSVRGDLAAVGVPGDDEMETNAGAVHLYQRRSDNTWHPYQVIRPLDADEADRYGRSVAVGDRTVLVGMPFADSKATDAGAVAAMIPNRNDNWYEHMRLHAGDAGDQFGFDLALDGTTVVVGAPGHARGSADNAGAAYVFERQSGAWKNQQKLASPTLLADYQFGRSVAFDGATIVVGAPGDALNGIDSGTAYVFDSSGGQWTQTARLSGSDTSSNDRFGAAVSVLGDRIVVGAPGQDGNGTDAGAAYVFENVGGSWAEQARVQVLGANAGAQAGQAVAAHAEEVLVAAPGDDEAGVDAGAIHVFAPNGTGAWNHTLTIRPDDVDTAHEFGAALALDGETLVAGAPGDDSKGNEAGAAWFLYRTDPIARFSYSPQQPTTSDRVDFDDESLTLSGIKAWHWDFGDGENASVRDPSHRYEEDGVYTVTLNVTSEAGGWNRTRQEVAIGNSPPRADFRFSPSSPTRQEAVTFTDTSTDPDGQIVRVEWDLDGDNRTDATTPEVVYRFDVLGPVTVNMTVTDDRGATDRTSDTLRIRNARPVVNFTVTPENATTAHTLRFESHSTDLDGEIVETEWEFGDGGSANGSVVEHKYAKRGTYRVEITITDDDGASRTDRRFIEVRQADDGIPGPGPLVVLGVVAAAAAVARRR